MQVGRRGSGASSGGHCGRGSGRAAAGETGSQDLYEPGPLHPGRTSKGREHIRPRKFQKKKNSRLIHNGQKVDPSQASIC